MRILLLLAALLVLAACDTPLGGRRYLPADTAIDPYQSARAQAEQYYRAGLTAESQGNMNQALDDFRQARVWDHDGRQDIRAALSRAEESVNRQALVVPTPASADPGIAVRRFQSLAFPYAMSVPVDWMTKQSSSNDQPVDTFTRPATTTLNAFVLIMVDPIRSGATLDDLYVASKRSLESEGVSGVQIVDRRLVGGQPAYVMGYRAIVDSTQGSILHAIVVTPAHAWHIILIATPSTTSELVKTFDVMLDSLIFEASAFPVL
jgi:hypothetical protein